MKKFLVTILALVYLTASSGATINFHYCMGKLVNWDLSHKSKSKCNNCGMEKAGHKGCCHDEQKQVKIEKDQKATESSFQLIEMVATALLPSHIELPSFQISSVTEENPVSNAPPRNNGVAVYILNRTFLI